LGTAEIDDIYAIYSS